MPNQNALACIHELVEQQVERTPDATAALFEDEALSYRELDARANRLARRLRAFGIGPEERVGICLERSLDMLVAVLATLKAGGAYVPLDPHYPGARILAMLEDARPRVLLTRERALQHASLEALRDGASDTTVLFLDRPETSRESDVDVAAARLPPLANAKNLAYILYTSGSTGVPKGVEITHEAVVNFLDSMRHEPGLSSGDSVLSVTTLAFDIAVLELFLPLIVGARVEIASRETAINSMALRERIRTSRPTLMQATPATWSRLVDAGWEGSPGLTILCGGEALTPRLARDLLARCRTLWNMYGPTETTIWSTIDRVSRADVISIGRPIANTRVYVLDSDLAHVPVATYGELFIGGDGVARGYHRRPDLTKERFIPDPFVPGARLYRTGDIARVLPDGRLEYLGRRDEQVKIRGFRIELGEVDAALSQAPHVRAAAVVAHAEANGEKRLVAYVVTSDERTGWADEIAASLRTSLPDFSIPEAFVAIESLPLTPNGKVDRKALATLGLPPVHAATTSAAAGVWERIADIPLSGRADAVAELVGREVAQLLSPARTEALDLRRGFFDQGLDSIRATTLRTRLEGVFGVALDATALFNHPSPLKLSEHLLVLKGLARAEQRAPETARSNEPLAIVGMSCRFPGGADEPGRFWQILDDGVDAVRRIRPERWNVEAVFDPDPAAKGKVNARDAALIDDIDGFDAEYFGISRREARQMEPRQRLLLELAIETLEDAAIAPADLPAKKVGVFVGMESKSEDMREDDVASWDAYSATGTMSSMAAGRVSFVLGLQGPSLTVDTACSSSLAAVHLARQSLCAGESDVALVGAINAISSAAGSIILARLCALAPDGRCKTFSAAADGYGRGEGGGFLVLKRLSRAEEDGDRIHAVIRGSAINHDGMSSGLTVPNGSSQETTIELALASAGVTADSVQYVEAHGTGTVLGDPIELAALAATYGKARKADAPLFVGSVKTNIGHLEAAAGMAGLMKVVLALQNERLPAHLHCAERTKHFAWDEHPVRVTTCPTPWPRADKPRRAGISAFGISGTNAHVIVEEAPRAADLREAAAVSVGGCLLPLSAQSAKTLDVLALRWANELRGRTDLTLEAVCRTAAVGRSHLEHRLGICATSREELLASLDAIVRGERPTNVVRGASAAHRPRPIFLFPGHGSQAIGMGRALRAAYPCFRDAFDRCAAVFDPLLERTLESILYPEPDAAPVIDEPHFAQPALFTIAFALAELWRSWGIEPAGVVGQSQGEIVAACVAGALRLEDAATIVVRRSQLLRRIHGHGAMAAVALSGDQAEEWIEPYGGRLSIAVLNGPGATTLSGDPDAMAAVLGRLEQAGIFCRRINVECAGHSAHMDPLRGDLVAALSDIEPQAAAVPFYSTVTCERLPGTALGAAYWGRNLRETVRFSVVIRRLLAEGFTHFLELSAHPGLSMPMSSIFAEAQTDGLFLPSLRRDAPDETTMMKSLSQLYVRGSSVNWKRVCEAYAGPRVRMPSYPFQREKYTRGSKARAYLAGPSIHPLLGARLSLAAGMNVFESHLSAASLPFLLDHVVYGTVVVPGTAILEIARAAAEATIGEGRYILENVVFRQPIVLSGDAATTVQTHVIGVSEGGAELRIFGRSASIEGEFTLHASGTFRTADDRDAAPTPSFEMLVARCSRRQAVEALYDKFVAAGIQYGPTFRGIEECWSDEGELLARLRLHDDLKDTGKDFPIHPAVLDAASQLGVAVANGPILPLEVERFEVRAVGPTVWAHARKRADREGSDDVCTVDITLFDGDRTYAGGYSGLSIKRPESTVFDRTHSVDRNLYELSWRERPRPTPTTASGVWLILGGAELGSQLAAELGARGAVCRLASYDGHQLGPIVRELQREQKLRGVVHLVNTEAAPHEPTTPDQLERFRARSVESALHLVHAVMQEEAPPRVTFVTRGACAIANVSDEVSALQSPLWGFARIAFREYPKTQGGIVDLPPHPEDGELEALIAELTANDAGEQVALRGPKRYVARIATHPPLDGSSSWKARGTWLVSGGLGGLGLHIARWLVDHGVQHLVLTGRHLPETSAVRDVLAELRARSADVRTLTGDVAVEADVREIFRRIDLELPPIGGLVHVAGVLDDGFLVAQTPERIQQTMAAKMAGAWNLHLVSRERKIDHFVLVSSTASLMGFSGQAGYAAANAFLDGLAHQRRWMGLPALSVNFGPWSGGGRLTDDLRREVERQGLFPLPPEVSLKALDIMMSSGAAQAMVANVDWPRFTSFYGERPPLFDEVAHSGNARTPARVGTQAATLLEQLKTLPLEQWRARVEGVLQEETAAVLGAESAADVPVARALRTLGLDSLMAVDLSDRISRRLGRRLPVTFPFTYPTIEKQARHLEIDLRAGDSIAPASPALLPTTSARVVEEALVLSSGKRAAILSRKGDGPPVVLVHGFGTNHRFFAGLASQLSADVVALSLPGRMKSDGPPARSIVEMARWVLEFLESRRMRGVVLAGHSMGGAVAVECARLDAAREGDRHIAALALISSGLRFEGIRNAHAARQTPFAFVENMRKELFGDEAPTDKTVPDDALIADFEACAQYEAPVDMPRVPTLLVVGTADHQFENATRLSRRVPWSERMTLEGVGHAAPLTHPDQVGRHLGAFQAKVARDVAKRAHEDNATRSVSAPLFRSLDLSESSITDAAIEASGGLTDFGPDEYQGGLSALLEASEKESQLNNAGRTQTRRACVAALINRLRIQQLLKVHPEILDIEINEPIFILGGFRTGTTLVHSLMSLDPANRAPRLFELLSPAPMPGATATGDPRLELAKAFVAAQPPEHQRIHKFVADGPEECVFLFQNSFSCWMFCLASRRPSYAEWLAKQDMVAQYRYYRKQLKILQWQRAGERLVLKFPDHLLSIEALLTVFPDARIIQTHRDPLEFIPSLCSLASAWRNPLTERIDVPELRERVMTWVELGLERGQRARAANPKVPVSDLDARETFRDPIAAIRRAYDRFALPLSSAHEQAMNDWMKRNPRDKYGTHSYSLEQYGMNAQMLRGKFAAYDTAHERSSRP